MVDSFYFTQMFPEDNIVLSPLSATPGDPKRRLGKYVQKLRRRQEFQSRFEFISLSHNPFCAILG